MQARMPPGNDMCNELVFVVIPAYNEARRLAPVVDELRHRYPNVVVVDDGSMDDTAAIARQHGCRVLRHAINRGQGAALQTGMTYSLLEGAQWIVTFDADGQHQTSDLPTLLAPVVAGEVDVTLGSRFLGETSPMPWSRRGLLWAARWFTRIVSGIHLTDCHNGLRVLSRRAAQRIHLRQDRMAHASEFYDQIKAAGLSYREVPVSVIYTTETLAKGQNMFNSVSIVFQYFFGRFSQ
jgi:polyprenyl-phospho-N-acetylgalactosaminyl synthase